MTVAEILDFVGTHSTGHTVITGGEPMIMPEIAELTQGLRRLGQHITIETAGTVFAPVVCDLMSISPKLANSTPSQQDAGPWAVRHEQRRIQPDVLRRLTGAYSYQLKFVVADERDLPELRSLAAILRADPARVVLMPEGTDPETLRARSRWLAEICKRESYRLTPRLHIDLWGSRRGV